MWSLNVLCLFALTVQTGAKPGFTASQTPPYRAFRPAPPSRSNDVAPVLARAGPTQQPGSIFETASKLMQQPGMMEKMMASPLVKQMMDDPVAMQQMLETNPLIKGELDKNPRLRNAIMDTEGLKKGMQMMKDPEVMKQLMAQQQAAAASPAGVPSAPGVAMDSTSAQAVLNDPEKVKQLLGSNELSNMINDPEMMKKMIESNPAVKQQLEANPELAKKLSDPQFVRESLDALKDPEALNEAIARAQAVVGGQTQSTAPKGAASTKGQKFAQLKAEEEAARQQQPELVTRSFTNRSILILGMIGLLAGTGTFFAVFCFRRDASASGRESLLAA